jgi:hypothetical protein
MRRDTTASDLSKVAFLPFGLRTGTTSFESSEPVIGEKESKSMSAKIKYTNELLGKLEVVSDFLPRPEDLVFRDDGVKVTLALSRRSVEFFKTQAQKHNTQYQRMIRRLLDAYAEHHAQPLTSRSSGRGQKRRVA